MTTNDYGMRDVVDRWRSELSDLITNGDERLAGILAARIVCVTNALARVESGRSRSLIDDPMYGRSMNVVEYFNNPRAATAEDNLGTINDWSI